MKLDLTKLPVAEAIIGFLIAALAVTFVLAFGAVNGGDEEQIVEPSPSASPGGSPSPGGPEVVMRDNSFAPNELTVKSGATVTIQLKTKVPPSTTCTSPAATAIVGASARPEAATRVRTRTR